MSVGWSVAASAVQSEGSVACWERAGKDRKEPPRRPPRIPPFSEAAGRGRRSRRARNGTSSVLRVPAGMAGKERARASERGRSLLTVAGADGMGMG